MTKFVISLLSFMLLSACNLNSIRYIGSKGEVSARESMVGNINTWSIKGKVSIITSEDSWNGSLNWNQVTDNFDIKIIGPLGSGSVHVTGDKNQVTLKTSDKKKPPVSAPDAEALLSKEMGWNMPVSQLQYWVKGMPNPHDKHSRAAFDKEGRPTSFQQSGWTINFYSYKKVNGLELPRKIYLEKEKFKIKMIIKTWEVET